MVKARQIEEQMLAEDAPDKHWHYFYFVKAVPHIFKDSQKEDYPLNWDSWSYSLTSNKIASEDGTSVEIRLSFLPISVVLERSANSFAKFLIHLCAIVGGVFVVFGIINGFLLAI